MFTLTKRFSFEASHRLPEHDGKCANLHGHSWHAALQIRGPALVRSGPKSGMLVDYGELENLFIKPLLAQLDHQHLNDHFELPTSENVAVMIFGFVEMNWPHHWSERGVFLHAVTIDETCRCSCEYAPARPVSEPVSENGGGNLL